MIPLTITFTGGLEMLFSNIRDHKIKLPSVNPATSSSANVSFLIQWLCDNLMRDTRRELFVAEDKREQQIEPGKNEKEAAGLTVRPGILALINDADWELESEGEYVL